MIEADLKTFFDGSAAIASIVASRIYASRIPQGVSGAAIVLRNISPEHFNTLANEANVVRAVVQIDCYDSSATKADTLGEKVRNRLSGYRGDAGNTTIQSAVIIRDNASTDTPENKSDRWIHRRSLDFSIHYTQAVPTHT